MIRIDSTRRTRLRTAIGAENLEAILAAAQLMDYEAPWQIPVHESGIFEDLRHEWLRMPVLALYEAIDDIARLNLTDDTVVGRKLRPTFTALARASERVGGLAGFFARFRPCPYLEVLIEMIEDGLQAAWLLSEALAADRDEVAWAATDAYNDVQDRIDSRDRTVVENMRYGEPTVFGVEQFEDEADEVALLLDIPALPSGDRWFDIYRGLEAQGHELWELGGRQLGYLGPFRPLTRAQADDYMFHAVRLGQSAYPLLAHRASQLTAELIRRALTVDRQATLDLIEDFYDDEAPLIQASGTRFSDAFERYRKEDDRPLIIAAYHALAEGVFRRFGSLVIALTAIANRSAPPTPFPLPTIGDVESRLASIEAPVAELLLEFVERELRNAGGHANVSLLGSGELFVRLTDGTSTTVIANHVYGTTAGMRSALNGVDTAINLTHAREIFATRPPTQKVGSIEALRQLGNMIANERTSGSIVRADANEGTLRLRFKGDASPQETDAVLQDLGRLNLIDEIKAIELVAENDETLGLFDRVSGKTTVQ